MMKKIRRMMSMSKKAYIYYNLAEVVSLEDASIEPNSSLHPIVFTTIMTNYGLAMEDSSTAMQTILNQLIRMVYDRFYYFEVFRRPLPYPYYQDANAPSSDERKEIFRNFLQLFDVTAPRYVPLLQQYNANKTDPIGKISSSSVGKTRFNDTPQDSGDFDDDSHTTHITQSEATTETDSGSIMERLDALYKNWRSILRDWTNEFRGLFYGEEGGL